MGPSLGSFHFLTRSPGAKFKFQAMDLLVLDSMLPIYVDYLGFVDRGIDGIEEASDAMKDLIDHGVTGRRFVPGAEMSFTKDQMILRSSPNRVSSTTMINQIFDKVVFYRESALIRRYDENSQ